MRSRVSADKSDDAEEQSISLLQSDAEAVSRDFRLRLTVLDLIEEGHKAAGIAISAALVTGVVLGLSLPVDHNIPGEKALCYSAGCCAWMGRKHKASLTAAVTRSASIWSSNCLSGQ